MAPESTDQNRHRRSRFGLGLALIALGGFVLRLVYTLANQNIPIQSDGLHYSYAATLLAEGKGFINPFLFAIDGSVIPDAVHPPAWTILLGGLSAAGQGSTRNFQIFAALIGTATIVMTGLAAREAFSRRIGLIAAGLAAVYPGIWLYERELVSEPLALLCVATLIWLTYRFRAAPGPWRALALGLVLGVAALTRSELTLIGVLVIAPVVLGARAFPIGRRLAWLATAAVATIVVIAPWFAFNTTRFSQPVPLSVGIGGTMVSGNCDQTYSGDLIGYYNFGCAVYVPNLDRDPSVSDGQMRQVALNYISEHKAEFVKVAAIRIGRTFGLYDPLYQRELETERGSPLWVITAQVVSYFVLIPFAIWGAVLARRRKVPIYPLLACVVIAVIVVIPAIGAIRYRALAEIGLVILAAVAVDAIVNRFRPEAADAEDVDLRDRPTDPAVAPPAPVRTEPETSTTTNAMAEVAPPTEPRVAHPHVRHRAGRRRGRARPVAARAVAVLARRSPFRPDDTLPRALVGV